MIIKITNNIIKNVVSTKNIIFSICNYTYCMSYSLLSHCYQSCKVLSVIETEKEFSLRLEELLQL